jgi:hypothetical protein
VVAAPFGPMMDDSRTRQREREIFDEQPVAVALGEMLDFDHLVAEALARRDGHLEAISATRFGLGGGEELLVRAEAGLALGLAGPR